MDGYDHLQLGIDVAGADKSTDSLDRLQAAMKKAGDVTVWTGTQAAAGLGAMTHAFTELNRESGSFIANHPLLTASIGKVGFEVTRHISSVESATNAYRALRLAMSPTAFTAATLGTGFAVEELLRNAEKVASATRKIAIEAAGSGMSFQQTLAMRTAGRIEGGDFSAVFAGKGTVEIAALAEQYRKLSDPVDKASFAVANFGDNAEKAMPMLRRGMEGSVSAANEFAGSVTKLDRESLERLSVQMNWYADMAHKVGAGFRSWWETEPLGRRWWAMMAAHENDRLLGTLAGQAGTVATGLAGNDTTRNFLSYLAGMPSFGSVAKSKADAEWFQSKIIKMQPVESGVLSRSDAAMAAYSASQAGLQGKLSEAEATRLKLRDQLYEARGTDLEATIRQRILGNEQEIAGYKAGIKVIEDQAAAVKELARQEEALAQLRKRSDEALMRATVGEDTPLAKYAATLGRVRLEQADFSRLNPQVAGGGATAFKEQTNAAWFTLQADTEKMFIEFDKKGVELGKQAVEVADKLGRDTVKLGEDFFREHPEIFGMRPQDRQFLTGFASPEQALRDAHDNERRALGLYGGQAALAGIPEITQARTLEALRKNAADEEYRALSRKAAITNDIQAEQDAIDQQHQKYLDATLERQQALLQAAVRQKQEFQSLAVGGVEALIHGQGAAFGQRFGTDLMDKIIGNLAGMGWKDISKIIPHASDPNSKIGQVLSGTMFGPDPLKGATDINTVATDLNTKALDDLTATLAAQRANALSATGGGGGFSAAASTYARIMAGAGFTPASAANWGSGLEVIGGGDSTAGLTQLPSGLWQRGPVGSDVASGAAVAEPNYMPADLISGGVGFPKNDPNAWMRNGMTLGKGVGIGAAALAGGFGIYSGIHAGGAQGALTAGGSAAGMAGTIISLIPKLAAATGPLAPILMGIGMALPLISSMLGDPKKNRAAEMDTWLQRHQFSMPDPVSIERDTRGRDVSYNMQGNLRPIQQTTNNYDHSTHVGTLSSIDSQDVARFYRDNAAALNKGVARAIDEGGELVPKLASAMGLQ